LLPTQHPQVPQFDEARGASKQPDELRHSQNWIDGMRPGNAAFVPPPSQQVADLLTNQEQRFIHTTDSDLPPLVRVALIQAQFETIHPFEWQRSHRAAADRRADGEHWGGLLAEPLMVLSGYLKQHRGPSTTGACRPSAAKATGRAAGCPSSWKAWLRRPRMPNAALSTWPA
jgi:hypothetical protein